MTLEVGFDTTALVQTQAGTARYINSLLGELRGRSDISLHYRSFGGEGRAWNLPRDAVWYPFVLQHATRAVDVLHCPTYRGPVGAHAPLVVTVHDLAIFRYPHAFNRWSRLYAPVLVPRVLRAARRLIAVSEFTRRELSDLFDVPTTKIRVIPNAVDPAFTPDGASAAGDYVLAVGTLEPRKNLGRVMQASSRLGIELRVVGARGWGRSVDMGDNGVRWVGRVSDDELAALYRGARVVVYASLYEGFGIPVLEAMACGVPVVTSLGGATEETAGGAAELVDPLDPAAIAAGIERALERREELVPRGLDRAGSFKWPDVAARTIEVYREAAG